MIHNVFQMLKKNALEMPDKKALSDENGSYSYREYLEASLKVAACVRRRCPEAQNAPVAVLIDRNIKCIAAFLGIAASGNFYVPIDHSMPSERVEKILKNLEPVLIVDARNTEGGFDGALGYQQIMETETADEAGIDPVLRETVDTDPLYAIFTSGSTGTPKGVLVSHRSVLDLVGAFEEAFHFPKDTVFGNQAPFDFDVSVKDIYNALYTGGSIEVLPQKLFRMPKLLVEYLIERKVDTVIWAVTALRIVADFKTLDQNEAPVLKNVMFSGEVMPARALNYWRRKVPGARYVNLYGPTEITCNCTYYEVKGELADDALIPVGKPFVNSRVRLLDADGKFITKPDEVGEICVSGTCLALGYWNEKQKTADAFVQDPSVTAYSSLMYKTGDMGYYNEDGDLVFAARKDNQIKHMGHRIELGEVEAALNAIPFLNVSCCIYNQKREKIVCFYQAEKECRKEIVTELAKKLPKYMWPNVYQHYEELPLNTHGKIDRVLLAKSLE